MTMQLIPLILFLTAESYKNNLDEYGTSNVVGTDTNCTCTALSGSVCMNYICSISIRRSSCFPGSSHVVLKDGTYKALSDVKIGDEVKVNQHNVYEPLIAFIHGQHKGIFGFLAFDLRSTVSNSSSTLHISPNHLIFDFDSGKARLANSFEIGDNVQLIENDRVVPGNVVQIRPTKQEGFYAPLTPSGTIVIDGVVCSNYAIIENHDLAHKAMSIYRWWISLVGASKLTSGTSWLIEVMYILHNVIKLLGCDTLLSLL